MTGQRINWLNCDETEITEWFKRVSCDVYCERVTA